VFFLYNNQKYVGETAVDIVRAIKADTPEYSSQSESVREFLNWSLARLSDRIHLRDLELSGHLSEETLAFNYLCLLDEHCLGVLEEVHAFS
jgi:hypothetical protein